MELFTRCLLFSEQQWLCYCDFSCGLLCFRCTLRASCSSHTVEQQCGEPSVSTPLPTCKALTLAWQLRLSTIVSLPPAWAVYPGRCLSVHQTCILDISIASIPRQPVLPVKTSHICHLPWTLSIPGLSSSLGQQQWFLHWD